MCSPVCATRACVEASVKLTRKYVFARNATRTYISMCVTEGRCARARVNFFLLLVVRSFVSLSLSLFLARVGTFLRATATPVQLEVTYNYTRRMCAFGVLSAYTLFFIPEMCFPCELFQKINSALISIQF